MSRLNPAARFSVIGVATREGERESCTDMDFGMEYRDVCVMQGSVFCWPRIWLDIGCIVWMEACIQANTTHSCWSLEYGNVSFLLYFVQCGHGIELR